MSRINWNHWLEHEGDELLTWLHESEQAVKRAIQGVWKFLVMKIPELCRHLLVWLEGKCIYACRVATRVARLAGLALVWLLIAGGPLAVYPGVITGAWGALVLAGSWWGLQRQHVKQQRVTITEMKGARNGR